MLLIAVTFIGDFLWLAYWTPHWWGSEQREHQFYLHTVVIFASLANFVNKLLIFFALGGISREDLNNLAVQ